MSARRLALLALVASALVGCGAFTAPSPKAAEMSDLVANFVRRGATITDQVGGDAGCADAALYGNAVRYDMRLPADPAPVPVYVLRWKSDSTFDAARAEFDACVALFEQVHPGAEVATYVDAPWRAYGPGWSPQLTAIVEAAVHEASGESPPDQIQ